MSILKKLGYDTIARLHKAASARHEEALYLFEGRRFLASIYLAGYSAEMTIGATYFRIVRRYGPLREIEERDLKTIVNAARLLSRLKDKAHPIDGLAHLLIRDKQILNPPGIDERLGQSLRDRVDFIAQNWGPRLRYRAIEATPIEARQMLETARWIIDHCPRL